MKRYLIIVDARNGLGFRKLVRKCPSHYVAYQIGKDYAEKHFLENRYSQVYVTTVINQKVNRKTTLKISYQ